MKGAQWMDIRSDRQKGLSYVELGNLTYENMEQFIKVLPKCDELMKVFNYIRYGAGLTQTSCYTAVRRWFMAQFPNIRKNPLNYFNCDFEIITDIEPIIKTIQEESLDHKKAA